MACLVPPACSVKLHIVISAPLNGKILKILRGGRGAGDGALTKDKQGEIPKFLSLEGGPPLEPCSVAKLWLQCAL